MKTNKIQHINILLFFILLILIPLLSFGQKFEWANKFGVGSGMMNIPDAITQDNAGNTIVAGGTNGSPINPFNIFIAKYDALGNVLWTKNIGSTGDDWGRGVTTDSSNNIYIVGEFQGTVDFDPSPGVYNLTSSQGGFILKLDPLGNFIWVKQIALAHPKSVQIDPMGDIVTVGYFGGTVDFDPSSSTFNLTATLQDDIFVQKIDSAGNLIWARVVYATYTQYEVYLDIDNVGNIHVTALALNNGNPSFVSAKITPQGVVSFLNTTNNAISFAIQADRSNNVYVAGTCDTTTDLNPLPQVDFRLSAPSKNNVFIQKFNSLGFFVTAKIPIYSIGNTKISPKAIRIDNENNIYIVGLFWGSADFDPSANLSILSSTHQEDMFIQKLDSNFNLIWVKQISGYDIQEGTDFVLDTLNNIFITGYFWGTVDFDPNSTTNFLTATAFYDVFVQKLSQCAASRAIITTCEPYTWINGNTYNNSNYTETMTQTSYLGCDSIITLNLTIPLLDTSLLVTDTSITSNATESTFRWLSCDSNYTAVSNATNATFTPQLIGFYAVEITQNGCVDTSDCVYIHPVSIQKINNSLEDISIYPNPSNGQYLLNIGKITEVSLKVFTVEGKLIYTENNINEEHHSFELKEPNGIYIAEIRNDTYIRYFKLIKNK